MEPEKRHTLFIVALLLFVTAGCTQHQNTGQQGQQASSIPAFQLKSQQDSPADSTRVSPPDPKSSDSDISSSRRNAITRAISKVSPAVVSITVTEVVAGKKRLGFDQYYGFFLAPGRDREFKSMGSGFIVSEDGKVVTNEHVCGKNAKKIMVTLSSGKTYQADVLGADEFADLAVLKIKSDKKFPHVEFGNSDNVIVGEWSIAIGNPFGLFSDGKPTVTVGVVSATSRDFHPNPDEPRVYQDMIQTDAAINRGNSGGPLVDSEGKVIGVNTFIYTGGTSNGFVGLGFAIPSNRAKKIVDQLLKSGEVKLGYDPGFEITPISHNMALRYNLPTTQGLLVVSVNKDGPAYEAGLLPGDIILKIGDERVTSDVHAWALFREYAEGDTMRVEILRKGQRYQAKMQLRKKVKAEGN